MSLSGEYVPSKWDWVKDQVEEYEASGGTRANTLRDSDMPIIVVTTRGAKSGAVRKFALMKVEHDGAYALVGSVGGAPQNPGWVHNIRQHPDEVLVQDGPSPWAADVREISDPSERAEWWERSVAAYPPYAEYQEKTDRVIPIFLATPRGSS